MSHSRSRNLEADIAQLIAQLIAQRGGSEDADLLHEMIRTTLGLIDDGTRRGELKLINYALQDLRTSFRVFGRYRDYRKVTVFGSARTPSTDPEYEQSLRFAERISRHGYMVITGAGDGAMVAANEGAGRDHSFGCLIQLPFEPDANDVLQDDEKLINFKYFFTRKLSFVKEADGFVLLPGGFGTLDECFEVLTLIQTGKSSMLPVVLLDAPGGQYWHNFERHLDHHLVASGRISSEDRSLYLITDDVETAVDEVVQFYRNYHSIRYVGDQTVLRHILPIDDTSLAELNDEFSDILTSGAIVRSGALTPELNEPEIVTLPRLVMSFNRRSFGRLRQLIDRLNGR